ncbi:MAG: type II toxin-antitoxin system PemK/MazF family toxin [Deltaproteobacteria bacterium]|nr:type II toxin-antitoxin system PemK/MazF family toxin [Deltaproteobacteria bacterium]
MIEAGAIVRIPFPFSNLGANKKRPVLVLCPPDALGDFLGMAVTSKGHHGKALAIGDADLTSGRLPLASWVRPSKVFTLDAQVVSDRVATVAPAFLQRALRELCDVVGGPVALAGEPPADRAIQDR